MLFNKLKIIFYLINVNKNTLLENEISLLINLFNKGFLYEVIEKENNNYKTFFISYGLQYSWISIFKNKKI